MSLPGPPVVLVVTAEEDATADAVVAEIDRLGAQVARIDLGDFPTRLRVDATIGPATRSSVHSRPGHGWQGRLWTDSGSVTLADVSAVYYRRPTRFRFPDELSDGDRSFASAEARLGLGGVLGALDVLWVNHPARAAVAEYKPLQLKVAHDCGLRIPRTLITNDHAAVTAFARHISAPIICKTLSSLVLSEGGRPQAIYTTAVIPADIDPKALAVTAHLIQERVAKEYDVRVTMVGRTPLAVAITTDSPLGQLDWRADYPALAYSIVEPPELVTAAMARYLDALDLSYGAFDFAITSSGEWIMLECNPAGQWLWLQQTTGLPIAARLGELLVGGIRL
jgi:ATP-grasp ribosomal peptide maturase